MTYYILPYCSETRKQMLENVWFFLTLGQSFNIVNKLKATREC